MSNELVLLNTNGQLPDYLRTSGLTYQDSGLSAGVTPRAPKLGITTAKQWTVTKDGTTMILPQLTVRGVIIGSAMNITKAWYEKPFVPGSTEAPDCYSDDGKSPAPGVKKPQCSSCAGCPKNAFGSHPTTGRGKACSDRKRVIFVWEHLPDELMTFNVPTMSLQALMKLDSSLRDANIPLQAVMVEMSFDPNVLYPVVKISAIGYIPQEMAFKLIDKASSQEVADLLRERDFDEGDNTAGQAQPQSPVPQQTVAMGAEVIPGAQQEPVHYQQTTPTPPAAPKRTRRTKAQIEADNAAAAAAAAQANQQQIATMKGQQAPVETDPTATVAADPTATVAADPVAAMQAQLAALQAQLAQVQQPVTPPPAQQPEVIPAGQALPAAAGAANMDVTALLAKWQNKG